MNIAKRWRFPHQGVPKLRGCIRHFAARNHRKSGQVQLEQIAKGALALRKRKIVLLEAEMTAPGKECAYLCDARKRFGSH